MTTTTGWTLDEQGRAMSKSLGNGIDPVDIANRLGADILRLWIASVDFSEDVAASENLMQRVSETYRKLRNTFRFLLSNLSDFSPPQHALHFTPAAASRPVHPRAHRRARRRPSAAPTTNSNSTAPTRPSTSSSTPTSARSTSTS